MSRKKGTKLLVLAFWRCQARCRRLKFHWLPLLWARCEAQLSGDRCARTDLPAVPKGRPGPGRIDEIVLHLFSDVIQSEIGSASGQWFGLSEVKDSEGFGMDMLLSYARFIALFCATQEDLRYHFRELGLGIQERSQKKLLLFYSKPAFVCQVSENSALSVTIARFTKENDQP
jgi:hypothetical protein